MFKLAYHQSQGVILGWEWLWSPQCNKSFVFIHLLYGADIINSWGSVRELIVIPHIQSPGVSTQSQSVSQSLPQGVITVVVQELVVKFHLVLPGVHDVLVLMSHVVNHAAVQHCLGYSCKSDRFTLITAITFESHNEHRSLHKCGVGRRCHTKHANSIANFMNPMYDMQAHMYVRTYMQLWFTQDINVCTPIFSLYRFFVFKLSQYVAWSAHVTQMQAHYTLTSYYKYVWCSIKAVEFIVYKRIDAMYVD